MATNQKNQSGGNNRQSGMGNSGNSRSNSGSSGSNLGNMNEERQRDIASKGGRTSHSSGNTGRSSR